MAEDAKAKDEDNAPPGVGSGVAARGRQDSTVPRREKPVIEGEALRVETPVAPAEAGPTASAEPPNDSDAAPAAALGGPEECAEVPVETDKVAADVTVGPLPLRDLPSSPRRRFGPFVAAIVLGALSGVGGAFVLHSTEKTPTELAVLEKRVTALEQRPEAAVPRQAGENGLDRRVSTLRSGVRSLTATLVDLQQNVQHLDAAQSRLEAAQKQAAQKSAAIGQTPSAKPVDLAALTGRVGRLEAAFAALEQKMRDLAGKFDARIHEAQAEKERAAQVAAADAVAIIAANLRREVEAGAGFAADLSALANQGFDKNSLAALAPVADSGVATPAMLAKQFATVVPDIIATEPTPKGEGFFGRLARDAAHLVRIRKIGDTSGHDLAAHVARIAAALDRGAVETAVHEWNALPAGAKAKSEAFGAASQRRVEALSTAKAIEADALAALAKFKS